MLLLRECAFQEEGQGPQGHKAWLMAKKCFFPSHENQGLHSSPPPPALHCSPLPAALLPFQQHVEAGERLPEPGRALLLHRGRSQPGLSPSHKAVSGGCHWKDTDKCRYSSLGLQVSSRKPSEQALHFGCGTWWLHSGKPPCLLCTMPGFCPMAPLQRAKLALGWAEIHDGNKGPQGFHFPPHYSGWFRLPGTKGSFSSTYLKVNPAVRRTG